MTTAYPGAIDNFTNPTATDTLNSLTVPHAAQHANVNDAIESVEGTLGTNPQGGYSTVAERVLDIETNVSNSMTDIGDLQENLGLSPFGSELALNVAQISAASGQIVSAVDVDFESGPAAWFSFDFNGTTYAVPGYTITTP